MAIMAHKATDAAPALILSFDVLFVENFSYTNVKRDFSNLPKQGESSHQHLC